MLLTAVRTGAHRCYDRVVFEFRPPSSGARLGFRLEYRPPPFTNDPQGDRVNVAGDAFVVVHLEPASGADLSKSNAPQTYTGPTAINPQGTRYVVQLKETGDFEAVMTWVIGLRSQRPFTARILRSPQSERLVIDFG